MSEGTEGADSSRPSGGSDPEGLPEEASTVAAIVDQVVTLVIAVTIALCIRHFLVEPFRIPSGSMFPTLLVGDHLFVNKLAYGPSIPFTDIRLPGLRDPERGDIVVFEVARPGGSEIRPVDRAPEGSRTEDFVKRVVGLPGDTVQWRHGQLLVNDIPVPRQRRPEGFADDHGMQHTQWVEDLGDCRHEILDDAPPTRDPKFERGKYVVEPGRYFMMGDNRDNSNDSRGWDTVRLEEMKGPAVILYWSWDVNGSILEFFKPWNWWSADKRWDRIFQSVECEAVEAAVADEPASEGAARRDSAA